MENRNQRQAESQNSKQKLAASRKQKNSETEISLTTAVVEIDGGNQTKEMTETEQMNSHRADEWSPSSGNAASRRRGTPAQREEQQQCCKGRKIEESERVQLELKGTERRMKRRSREGEEEIAQETRRQEGLKRGVTNRQPGGRSGPPRTSLEPIKSYSS
ncbi:hypothetical protein M9H77_34021 [Catharanthus roseus]|uniref:Uncharacterized protein n=1 Tax=Catharanthus roseus TaxID=4058 RepID=A0ACB9ZL66_CATRO|nr:hypothetical protein M9H77_34021 [Catharanthus roseus]